MPIFEYECRECGAKFEEITASQSSNVTCRKCSSSSVQPLLSAFAVSVRSGEPVSEPGPCPCGAPRRGMCGE